MGGHVGLSIAVGNRSHIRMVQLWERIIPRFNSAVDTRRCRRNFDGRFAGRFPRLERRPAFGFLRRNAERFFRWRFFRRTGGRDFGFPAGAHASSCWIEHVSVPCLSLTRPRDACLPRGRCWLAGLLRLFPRRNALPCRPSAREKARSARCCDESKSRGHRKPRSNQSLLRD